MDLRPTNNAAAVAKIGNPSGEGSGGRLAALLLSHRTLGYASSSRLASRPPKPRALISYL
jgi:hypothetical protein